MTRALALILSLTLLAQGVVASAMPIVTHGKAAAAAMPCHGAAGHKASTTCCDPDSGCAAVCAAVALLPAMPAVAVPAPQALAVITAATAELAPHRFTPLRPPIERSA